MFMRGIFSLCFVLLLKVFIKDCLTMKHHSEIQCYCFIDKYVDTFSPSKPIENNVAIQL